MPFKDITDYGFGQMGSGYLDGTTAMFPPVAAQNPTTDNMVVVAITIVKDCKFTNLIGDTSGHTNSTGTKGVSYIGTQAQLGGNGTNSGAVVNTDTFPRGMTIYGRWSVVQLAAGAVICYFGHK